MSEIQVTTSDLRNGSQNLNGVAGEIGGVQSVVTSAPASVGNAYDGQLRKALEGIVGGSAQTGARLQNRAVDLGNELFSRATGFETANEAGKSAVLGASTAYINFLETTKNLGHLSFLSKLKETALSIWNMGGLAIGGLASLIFVSTKPGILTPFPETGTSTSSSATTSVSVPTEEKKSGFGELIEKAKQEKLEQEKQKAEQEKLAQEKQKAEQEKLEEEKKKAEADHWWLDVPTQSQQGLKLNGKSNKYGCAPTSTSMILDYWHSKDSANKTMSAQDLIDMNAKQGEFKSTGMSASDIHDEVSNLGYFVVKDYTNADLGGLKDAVANGPVIAIVKLGIKSTGTNHAVVVTGISSDNQVQINDPWDGQSHTYSWDDFSKSWGASFGDKSAPKNSFVVIRP